MGTSGCDGDTTSKGMPNVGPNTKWMFVATLFMLASHVALCGFTGRFAIGVFQTLSDGKMGQLGAPGKGVPAEARTGGPIVTRLCENITVAMHTPAKSFDRFTGVLPYRPLSKVPRTRSQCRGWRSSGVLTRFAPLTSSSLRP